MGGWTGIAGDCSEGGLPSQVEEIAILRGELSSYLQDIKSKEIERTNATAEISSIKEMLSTRKAEQEWQHFSARFFEISLCTLTTYPSRGTSAAARGAACRLSMMRC